MSKITSYSADYQTFPTLFELESVGGKKVTVDFSAPKLSSLGGLPLVREHVAMGESRFCHAAPSEVLVNYRFQSTAVKNV